MDAKNRGWLRVFFAGIFLLTGLGAPGQERGERGLLRLTLEEAINRALQANRTIANAVDNVSQSSYSLAASRADFQLQIYPQIYADMVEKELEYGAGATFQKKLSTGTTLSLSPTLIKTGGEFAAGVEVLLTQPLLRGRSREYNLEGLRQSEYSLRATRRDLYLTQVSVVVTTVTAVYDVIRSREVLRLHRSSYDRSVGYSEAAEVKQKMGMATAIDVYRARIKQKQAESLLVSSRESYQDALDNLRIILALPLDQAVEVEAPLEYGLLHITEAGAIDISMRERMEVAHYKDLVSNLRQRTRADKHGLLPDLDLALRYTNQGTGGALEEGTQSGDGRVEVGLSSSGNARRTVERARYEISRLAVTSAERLFSLKKDEIKREVKFALRNLSRAEKNITIQEEQIDQARGKLELAKVKFSRGMAGNFDLVEAETELREAEIGLISAVISYIVGSYRLRSAMGTLLDKEGRVSY
jgi:outer membrane protein